MLVARHRPGSNYRLEANIASKLKSRRPGPVSVMKGGLWLCRMRSVEWHIPQLRTSVPSVSMRLSLINPSPDLSDSKRLHCGSNVAGDCSKTPDMPVARERMNS